jgi:hypothetical protein
MLKKIAPRNSRGPLKTQGGSLPKGKSIGIDTPLAQWTGDLATANVLAHGRPDQNMFHPDSKLDWTFGNFACGIFTACERVAVAPPEFSGCASAVVSWELRKASSFLAFTRLSVRCQSSRLDLSVDSQRRLEHRHAWSPWHAFGSYAGDWVTRSIRRRGERTF